ncbi:iron permease FTR1 [Gloeothece citriformis PCC 7424]|uniref:Iron permease FTR1 n=1 Tax=Gloeothece citriformis (strain PCC 7424) TaxID=65393 RepID=B7KI36_GLOC7|nr:FTR1 family protein [Gloeothece citriformis]ACK73523.1 iron permease FTR1 [Gloeothece citriformis PCC 7424]
MDISAALPTFVITLREGFEAALVVGIVLACLQKANQSQLNSWVYRGIGGGIVASVMVGLLLGGILQSLNHYQTQYAPIIKEILEGLFGLIAIVMLSWMLLWMTQQAKSMKSEVEGAIKTALAQNKQAGKAIFLLVFIAVVREGFETVLFIIAKFEQGWIPTTIGAIAGLLSATLLGILLFKWGVKINLRLFFQIMGVFLLLIVGGLVISVLKHLDVAVGFVAQLNWQYGKWCFYGKDSCLLGPQVWNGSEILPDRQFPGIILKSLFGYRETLYLGQAIAYSLFILVIGGAYFQSLGGKWLGNSNKQTSVPKPNP